MPKGSLREATLVCPSIASIIILGHASRGIRFATLQPFATCHFPRRYLEDSVADAPPQASPVGHQSAQTVAVPAIPLKAAAKGATPKKAAARKQGPLSPRHMTRPETLLDKVWRHGVLRANEVTSGGRQQVKSVVSRYLRLSYRRSASKKGMKTRN